MGTKTWDFTEQVIKGRWFSVFAGLILMLGNGSTYIYGTYSKVIKTGFNYSQTQLSILGFAKDLGSNVGIFAGLLAEVAPPWVLFLTGLYGPKDPSNLVLLFAWLPSTLILVLSFSIRLIRIRKHPEELKVFYHFLYAFVILALFILFSTIAQKEVAFSRGGYRNGAAVIIVLLFLPLVIVCREEHLLYKLNKQNEDSSFNDQKPRSSITTEKIKNLRSCF
uniref:Nodulin-like domain-containing protein n=1 Tax=Cucumis sativus TaxID=3659 RepID=A0A0A0LUU8_CUCSA